MLALNILLAASRFQDGVLVRVLVDALVRYEGSTRGAARVQLTRTSRQLWEQGLAELHGCANETMTERVVERHEVAARAFASPEKFYDFCTKLRGNDPWGDAATCARAKAKWAQQRPRFHVSRITATDAGRARIAALLASAGTVISPPAGTDHTAATATV
jgi:hypothetical protein